MNFSIKSGDTSPSIAYVPILQADQILTGATVVFSAVGDNGLLTIDKQAASIAMIDVDGEGTMEEGFKYDWKTADTLTMGLLKKGEFQVTFADGSIETFPNVGYIDLTMTEELA